MSLTPEEDEDLRRITELSSFGALPPRMDELIRELRARDRRAMIREPLVIAEWLPSNPRVVLPEQVHRDEALDSLPEDAQVVIGRD